VAIAFSIWSSWSISIGRRSTSLLIAEDSLRRILQTNFQATRTLQLSWRDRFWFSVSVFAFIQKTIGIRISFICFPESPAGNDKDRFADWHHQVVRREQRLLKFERQESSAHGIFRSVSLRTFAYTKCRRMYFIWPQRSRPILRRKNAR
jgi:hypothetical protein